MLINEKQYSATENQKSKIEKHATSYEKQLSDVTDKFNDLSIENYSEKLMVDRWKQCQQIVEKSIDIKKYLDRTQKNHLGYKEAIKKKVLAERVLKKGLDKEISNYTKQIAGIQEKLRKYEGYLDRLMVRTDSNFSQMTKVSMSENSVDVNFIEKNVRICTAGKRDRNVG